jgi:hypothetical protein
MSFQWNPNAEQEIKKMAVRNIEAQARPTVERTVCPELRLRDRPELADGLCHPALVLPKLLAGRLRRARENAVRVLHRHLKQPLGSRRSLVRADSVSSPENLPCTSGEGFRYRLHKVSRLSVAESLEIVVIRAISVDPQASHSQPWPPQLPPWPGAGRFSPVGSKRRPGADRPSHFESAR